MRTKAELLGDVQGMFRGVLAGRSEGARQSRAQGYLDGYMRALLETGAASKEELLEIVSQERERASGPALRTLDGLAEESVQVA
jgi:hypothetical protein